MFNRLQVEQLSADQLDGFLPGDARQIMHEYDDKCAVILRAAEAEFDELRAKAIEQLVPLGRDYARHGRLEEALAISETIARLQLLRLPVVADPGSPQCWIGEEQQTYFVLVMGQSTGPLWGTDVYTADSTIATAAVHTGILAPGIAGVVKLELIPGQESYSGSERHGVASRDWGPFATSFRLEQVDGLRRLPAGVDFLE